MNNEKEKLQLLGWFIVRGASKESFNSILGANQQYCKLAINAINSLPKKEFPQCSKNPYIELIKNYTNYREENKRYEREDLVKQIFDIDSCLVLLVNNGFFPTVAFNNFKGFGKIIEYLSQSNSLNLSEKNWNTIKQCIKQPVLNSKFYDALTKPVDPQNLKRGRVRVTIEELGDICFKNAKINNKIIPALKEDYWIHIGRYSEPFGIKENDYFITNSDFKFLFEVNKFVLKKIKLEKKNFTSDFSEHLILLCSRLTKIQQLELLELLEDVCNIRIDKSHDTGKAKIRLLGNLTDYSIVKEMIKFKYPDMQITM